MIIFGILSIFQAIFLPGFIIIAFLNLHKGILRCIILSAALSPIVNFFIVYLLTALHCYTELAIYIVIATEICLLLLYITKKHSTYEFFPDTTYNIAFIKKYDFSRNFTAIHLIIFFLMFCVLTYFVNHFTESAITPFHTRDALISFHKWALDWSHNLLPTQTYDYPQLLSANWSISYLLIRTSIIQIFAHAFTALFPLLLLLIIFDLALREKKLAYLIGFIATGYLLIVCNAPSGNLNSADVPCAFLATTSFYLLFLARSQKEAKKIKQLIFLGAVTASGAALTKQSGLYIALLYPLMSYFIALKNKKVISKPFPIVIKSYLLILILILPWYLYIERQLLLNKTSTSYSSLLIHQLEDSYLQRPGYFYTNVMPLILSKVFALIVLPITLIFGLLASKFYRRLFLYFVSPFFIIWLFFFSYDCRNLAIIFPLIGIIMGFGIEMMILLAQKAIQLDKRITKKRAHFLIALLVTTAFLSLVTFQYNSNKILLNQTELELAIGFPQLNHTIYSYLIKNNYRPKVLTNATYLKYLPKLSGNVILSNFLNQKKLLETLKSQKPALVAIVKLLLTQQLLSKTDKNILLMFQEEDYNKYKIKDYIDKKLLPSLPKHHKIILDDSGYMIIKINWKT